MNGLEFFATLPSWTWWLLGVLMVTLPAALYWIWHSSETQPVVGIDPTDFSKLEQYADDLHDFQPSATPKRLSPAEWEAKQKHIPVHRHHAVDEKKRF